jgi:hypothetical protein
MYCLFNYINKVNEHFFAFFEKIKLDTWYKFQLLKLLPQLSKMLVKVIVFISF